MKFSGITLISVMVLSSKVRHLRWQFDLKLEAANIGSTILIYRVTVWATLPGISVSF